MNAPVNIPRAAYYRTVERLVPSAMERERDLRASMLLMRDNAAAALNYCHADAAPVLAHIADLAGRYALAGMSVSDLEEMRRLLVRLTTCASGLEGFHSVPATEEPDACA